MPVEPDPPECSSMAELHAGVAACTRCSLEPVGYWKFSTAAHGNPSSRVWLVGLNPRDIQAEIRAGETPRYWTGPSGRNLRSPIEEHFGRTLEELVYLTDVVKCCCGGAPGPEPP